MRRLLAFGLAASLLAGAAVAQPLAHKPAPPPRIFLSPSGEPFRLSSATPDPLKAWFDQVDANHDGVIDRFEFRADAARFFKSLDANGDGEVDGFEVSDYEHKIAPELGEQAEGRLPGQYGGHGDDNDRKPDRQGRGGTEPHRESPDGPPLGGKGQGPERRIGQLIDEPEPVSGADFNLDSHITQEEWMRATDQRFDLLDTAKTGRLTLDGQRVRLEQQLKKR
jgi:hypothetical protein